MAGTVEEGGVPKPPREAASFGRGGAAIEGGVTQPQSGCNSWLKTFFHCSVRPLILRHSSGMPRRLSKSAAMHEVEQRDNLIVRTVPCCITCS